MHRLRQHAHLVEHVARDAPNALQPLDRRRVVRLANDHAQFHEQRRQRLRTGIVQFARDVRPLFIARPDHARRKFAQPLAIRRQSVQEGVECPPDPLQVPIGQQ